MDTLHAPQLAMESGAPAHPVLRHFEALATGDVALIRSVVAPEHVNHMAGDEPPACALRGPAGFLATSAWLRFAFQPLSWEPLEVVVEGSRIVAHVRMRGTHVGPFVVFPAGQRPEVFPPTGRSFSVRQAHFFTMRDGRSVEHIAVRDDLGMMQQLGYLPPTPAVGLRLAAWKLGGRSARAVREVNAACEAAAARAMGS